jgi:hypothetical protein
MKGIICGPEHVESVQLLMTLTLLVPQRSLMLMVMVMVMVQHRQMLFELWVVTMECRVHLCEGIQHQQTVGHERKLRVDFSVALEIGNNYHEE